MNESTVVFDPKNHKRFEYGFINYPNHPDFDPVYECYKKCFPLPTEQESKENFLAFLEDNKDATKPGREMWVYIKDRQTGEVLGANNFDAFPATLGHDINGTCQDIYMFVDEKHRKQGIYSKLIELREHAAAEYLKEIGAINDTKDARVCTFVEQNNALMMTPAQYIEDTEAAIDQCVRRSIYERPIKMGHEGDQRVPGFRTIQMRYVQPALDAGGEVCDYLDYVVKTPNDHMTIPADIVRGHLERFFEKSFPEGTSFSESGLEGMKRDLEAIKDLPLEPEGKFEALGKHLSIDAMKKVPEIQRETRIGELRPDLVGMHFGNGIVLETAMDGYTRIRDKTGHTEGMVPSGVGGGFANPNLKAARPEQRGF